MQLETQLSHAQKMESVGQLAAGIAHEINTHIQYVGDNTRFLKTSFDDMLNLVSRFQELLDTTESLVTDTICTTRFARCSRRSIYHFCKRKFPPRSRNARRCRERGQDCSSMKDFSHPGTEEKQQINLNQAVESTLLVSKNVWKYHCELVTNFDPSLPLVPCLQAISTRR